MSLQTRTIPPIPELTAKVARRAFRKGNVYMRMRDVLRTFFTSDHARLTKIEPFFDNKS